MTRPLQVLASAWTDELEAIAPAARWDIDVLPEDPVDELHPWECLFWKP